MRAVIRCNGCGKERSAVKREDEGIREAFAELWDDLECNGWTKGLPSKYSHNCKECTRILALASEMEAARKAGP